ncbi:MAG: HD domain-containing protein [Gemmatimonadaceae bacterium]|nr:HD domain-containing protein [Gemmatimonadaceae bacterium]
MRIRSAAGFLDTKVGRHTLLHFLSAALLPVLVSSLVGIWYVRRSLEQEAGARVQRTAKSAGVIVLRELSHRADHLGEVSHDDAPHVHSPTSLIATADERSHLATGRPLLRLDTAAMPGGGASPGITLWRQLADGHLTSTSVSSADFWGVLGEMVDFDRSQVCVFEVETWRRVHCTSQLPPVTEAALRSLAIAGRSDAGDSTTQVVGRGEQAMLAAQHDIYLRYEWGAPEWRLIVVESRAAALAPTSSVTTSLLLLVALAMVSAFTFAHVQIRRSTAPLEALRDATRRVAAGDLETPVHIQTRDEYGELGAAFNGMTGALGRQLGLLQRMDAVDEATLRERQISAIVTTALQGFRETARCVWASVVIVDDTAPPLTHALTQWWMDDAAILQQRSWPRFTEDEQEQCAREPRMFSVGASVGIAAERAHSAQEHGGATVTTFAPNTPQRDVRRDVYPFVHDGVVLGALIADFSTDSALGDYDRAAARRIADRVALGVANVQLLSQLDALSTGTLRAFAQAIDANSAWTAGHSERVTHVALILGQQLELSDADLATLYRGGLMHDIGKIGIPASILDKAGKLTVEERIIIEQHPVIGERILRPIPGFADALPIVRSHHERFDGTGYPDRTGGTDIPYLARIAAVADVFDALTSDRPYRSGLSHRAAMTMIESQSGSHFDPRVVDALLRLEYTDVLSRPTSEVLQAYSVAGVVKEPAIRRTVADPARRALLTTI